MRSWERRSQTVAVYGFGIAGERDLARGCSVCCCGLEGLLDGRDLGSSLVVTSCSTDQAGLPACAKGRNTGSIAASDWRRKQ